MNPEKKEKKLDALKDVCKQTKGSNGVQLLTQRAPELVEQYSESPDTLIQIVGYIEGAEPLPLVPEMPGSDDYPTDALLGMAPAIELISNELQMPAAMVGQCALGMANSVIHGLVDIQKPSYTKPRPCSLFMMTGADSGEGKSMVDNILSSQLLEQCFDKEQGYQESLREFDIAQRVLKSEERKIEGNKDLSAESCEQQLKALTIPTPPMNPRLKVADFTIEGLGRAFREGCSRLSAMTDEGALIFEGHAMKNERRMSVLARCCKLWDGTPWENDRGKAENNFQLYGRRLAMSISTQTSVLKGVMSDRQAFDQGFLARFLVAIPDSTIYERRMVDIDWSQRPVITDYWKTLKELYSAQPNVSERDSLMLKPRALQLSPDAKKIHKRYGNNCFQLSGGEYQAIRPMVLKAEENLLRVAATLAIWNNPDSGEINTHYLEAAEYIIDFYLKEALRVVEYSSGPVAETELDLAFELLTWIKKERRFLVYSQLLTQHAPRRDMRKARTIKSLMGAMVEHGHAIRLEDKPIIDGSRRKDAWLITS